MANYANLKAALNAAIYTNTQRAITGDVLNAKMDEMIDALGAGYQYMGAATPSTNPGTPDCNVVYLAATAGTYPSFGGLTLASGKIGFFRWNGTWQKDEISVQAELTVDTAPTSGSGNPVASGGVFTALQGKQDTLESGVNIKTVNNISLLGGGDIPIEGGVGIDDISAPSTPDGSMQITLSNGDIITIDLNHNHPQYLKYVYLTDESQMPANPDSTTLYLILNNA